KIKDYSYNTNKEKVETDEQLREYLISNISRQLDFVVSVQDVALQSQMLMIWGDLDRLIGALRDARLVIKETDYKGTTFFISSKTFENDELLVYDFQTIELLKKQDKKLEEFNESVESAILGDTSKHVSEILGHVYDFTGAWNERISKIREFKAF
ncbi:MAG: hypothetical protein ACFFD4_39175, partial [Candidatus Odinarchaeota archaeon]